MNVAATEQIDYPELEELDARKTMSRLGGKGLK